MNLYRLERKLGKFALPNFMFYIVATQLAVYLINMLVPNLGIYNWLYLSRDALLRGEIWRLVSFIFLPPMQSPVFVIFSLYFYYLIGSSLENNWGTFRFQFYYMIGMVGAIVSALLTGYASNLYLNYSLFFAFAMLFPNHQVLLFFFIPIKIKYLALLDAAFFLLNFISGSIPIKAAIIFSLINFFLFFWNDLRRSIKNQYSLYKHRKNYRNFNNRF
ncbi:MAG: hypothetical protein ACOX60_10225 [Massiliimalia sp.]